MQNTDKELGKTIGKAIAKHRQAAGLTQAQVAEIMNISNDAVSRMERGGIMPSVARLIQLADIFQCNAADLLTESSLRPSDQSQYLFSLLSDLNETERTNLLNVIESMVKWYKQSSK